MMSLASTRSLDDFEESRNFRKISKVQLLISRCMGMPGHALFYENREGGVVI